MQGTERFLFENKDLKLVSSAPNKDQEVLLWAFGEKYINLIFAPEGEACYNAHLLDVARMWKEKVDVKQ